MNQYKLLIRQTELEVISLEQQFQTLLNTRVLYTTSMGLEVMQPAEANGDPSLWVQQAKKRILVEDARIQAIKAERNPSFLIGYSAQSYYDGGWQSGIIAGLSIPLFNSQVRKRAEAQKLQVEISMAHYESIELQSKQQLLAALNAIALYKEGMTYYKDQVDAINPELERIADLNYQAGEISYLELLNIMNLSAQNNIHYWEQVLAYNKAVVLYQFLINQ